MSDNYVRSDAVDIKSLVITSADGKRSYNLMAQVLSFDIYEDIMYPVTRGDFYVNDALDILGSFPIIGEETIDVEFGSPGYDITCKYTLHVLKVDNQYTAPSSKSKSYVLRCASEEFVQNATKFITGKLRGNTDALIQFVVKNELHSNKTVAIEPTKGIQDTLISRMRPLQVIDMFRKRSASLKYASSSYVFFENKRGFNFCTIEFLMDQLQENIKDKTFVYDPAASTDIRNMNTRNIISFMQMSQIDNTKKLTQGGLHNRVKRFDLMTGNVTETVYKNSESESKFKYGSKKAVGLNTTNFQQKNSAKPAQSMLVPHSSHLPENYIDSTMGAKHAYITKLGQNIYQMLINGDPVLTAGDVITVNIPAATGDNGIPTDSRLTSGNYLISKLRHCIQNNQSKQKSYMISLELIKGFSEDHA
jgi:hypothetical protein